MELASPIRVFTRVAMTDFEAEYLAACYRILVEPPCDFFVGKDSRCLQALMGRFAAHNAVLITPANPFSRLLSVAENQQRADEFIELLRRNGFRFVPTRGIDPRGVWPEEQGALVFDVSLDQVDAWLQQFEQNAVVMVEARARTELRWHPFHRGRRGSVDTTTSKQGEEHE